MVSPSGMARSYAEASTRTPVRAGRIRRGVATDMTIVVENRPGALANIGEATGQAGINIYGVSGMNCEGRGVIHLLVGNAAKTREAVEAAGLEVIDEREVLMLDVEDRAGEMGNVARQLAEAGV